MVTKSTVRVVYAWNDWHRIDAESENHQIVILVWESVNKILYWWVNAKCSWCISICIMLVKVVLMIELLCTVYPSSWQFMKYVSFSFISLCCLYSVLDVYLVSYSFFCFLTSVFIHSVFVADSISSFDLEFRFDVHVRILIKKIINWRLS